MPIVWGILTFLGKLFTGSFGVVANYIMIGVVVLLLAGGAYWKISHDTEQRVRLELQVKDLQEKQKLAESMVEFYKRTLVVNAEILQENADKIAALEKERQSIIDYISGKAGANDQVPDIIKEYFRLLLKGKTK